MKNASRTKVREATDRGSTLFYHSRRPVDAGQTEGFHIPRAPGRLQPVTRPLCSLEVLLLFPINTLFHLRFVS